MSPFKRISILVALSCIPSAFAFAPSSSSAGISSSSSIHDGNSALYSTVPPLTEAADAIEFPEPLSKVERVKRAATFWSLALPIIASYYGKNTELKLRETLLGECLSDEECEVIWDEEHEKGASTLKEAITTLKGFYVKTAQIIASRSDLFPRQYTEKLSGFTDNLDPMPVELAKAVISQELLHEGETFEDMFIEFDEVPLGAASIAQVHRAVLSEQYGGPREVAVKVQRPAIEPKLMGDIANLKQLAKTLQGKLPLDYYTVFSELEVQLADEFDFVKEAVAMDRIYTALSRSIDGSKPAEIPLVIPRPVPGLVCGRVLVMDFLRGVPLSRAREEMEKKGIDPNSPESKLFGRKLLRALTYVFGRSILETGFFHADPHPGNIFVLEDGSIGLIDFGQVKQITGRKRETLAKLMVSLVQKGPDGIPEDLKRIGDLAIELGVEIKEDAKEEAACATAIWLFDGSVQDLPGGYENKELSGNSPVNELKSFPQDLVLVGRASVLIKGLSARLNIPWSLANEWAPIAQNALDYSAGKLEVDSKENGGNAQRGVRFRDVLSTLKLWGKAKGTMAVTKLPQPIRARVAAVIVKIQDRRARQKLVVKK